MRLRVFGSASPDAARNLALEELLLDSLPEDSAYLLLYRDQACVVIGRNQDPRFELAPGARLPVFRRVSGGGAVYHDLGNLNWSFILPRALHDPLAELELVAAALEEALAPSIRLVPGLRGGLFVAAAGAGGEASGAGVAEPGPKVSGDARRFGAKAVLHHGTLLLDADLVRLEASLLAAPGGAVPSVPSPVANLGALCPALLGEEGPGTLGLAGPAAELLVRAFARRLGLPPPSLEDPLSGLGPAALEALGALEARHRSGAWVSRGEPRAARSPEDEPSAALRGPPEGPSEARRIA